VSESLPVIKGRHKPDPEKCARCREQVDVLFQRAAEMMGGTPVMIEHDEPETITVTKPETP
jgi:hypothetical protein